MLMQRLVRKRKTLAVAASVAFFASAFQTGGCTVNVDEGLLQSLSSMLENVEGVRWGPGSVDFSDNNEPADNCDVDEPNDGNTDDGDAGTSRCN